MATQAKPQFVKHAAPQFSSREMRDDYYRALYAKRMGVNLDGTPLPTPGAPQQPGDGITMDIPWSLSKLVIGVVLLFKCLDRVAKLLWHAFAFVTLVTVLVLLSGLILA